MLQRRDRRAAGVVYHSSPLMIDRPGAGRAGDVARAARGVRGARRDDRRCPQGREPHPGRARRGRGREDGAAGVRGRVGVGSEGRAGGRAWSPRWSWRSPLCISCARRCSIGSSGFRLRSARRWGSCSGSARALPPDRFLVGLAVLSLLSEVAEERPLLCVVDDAQWLDQASARTLGVRRAAAAGRAGRDRVRRARARARSCGGLPELEVEGLRDGDARALLGSVVRFVLDERVRDRIVAETRGNPLALLELPRGLTRDAAGRVASGCWARRRCRGGSRRASGGGSRRCRRTRGACCWSRRRSRSAIRLLLWRAASGSGSRAGGGGRRDARAC